MYEATRPHGLCKLVLLLLLVGGLQDVCGERERETWVEEVSNTSCPLLNLGSPMRERDKTDRTDTQDRQTHNSRGETQQTPTMTRLDSMQIHRFESTRPDITLLPKASILLRKTLETTDPNHIRLSKAFQIAWISRFPRTWIRT